MPHTNQSLEPVFVKALEIFLKREADSILSGIAERALCGRLAIYLEALLLQSNIVAYYADVEYNRNEGGKIKTILDDEEKIIPIQCDLILHSRGEIVAQDNLIAIEMKKSNRPASEKKDDKNRLRALTKESYDDVWSFDGKTLPEHVCGYVLGFYIELNIASRTVTVEKYEKGLRVAEGTADFG